MDTSRSTNLENDVVGEEVGSPSAEAGGRYADRSLHGQQLVASPIEVLQQILNREEAKVFCGMPSPLDREAAAQHPKAVWPVTDVGVTDDDATGVGGHLLQ